MTRFEERKKKVTKSVVVGLNTEKKQKNKKEVSYTSSARLASELYLPTVCYVPSVISSLNVPATVFFKIKYNEIIFFKISYIHEYGVRRGRRGEGAGGDI